MPVIEWADVDAAITLQVAGLGEQRRVGHAPIEQGDTAPGGQGLLDQDAADETGATEDEEVVVRGWRIKPRAAQWHGQGLRRGPSGVAALPVLASSCCQRGHSPVVPARPGVRQMNR